MFVPMFAPQLFGAPGPSSRTTTPKPPAYSPRDVEMNPLGANANRDATNHNGHYCLSCKSRDAIVPWSDSSLPPPSSGSAPPPCTCPAAAAASDTSTPTPTPTAGNNDSRARPDHWVVYIAPLTLPIILFLQHFAIFIMGRQDSPIYLGWILYSPMINVVTLIALGMFLALYLLLGRPRSKPSQGGPHSTHTQVGPQRGIVDEVIAKRFIVIGMFSNMLGIVVLILLFMFWFGAWTAPLKGKDGNWVMVWAGYANETAGKVKVEGWGIPGVGGRRG